MKISITAIISRFIQPLNGLNRHFQYYREEYTAGAGIIGSFGTLFSLALFGRPIFSALVGLIGGWIAGWFFTGTVLGTLARFGVDTDGLSLAQISCTFGFIAGFFNISVDNKIENQVEPTA